MAEKIAFKKLWIALVLTFLLTLSEFVLSHYSHCITLAVTANQSMFNLLMLIAALTSSYLNNERSCSLFSKYKPTYGWTLFNLVASLSSLIFLSSLCFGALIEVFQTVFHNDHLHVMHHPFWVLIIAFVHLMTWIVIASTIGGFTCYQNKCILWSEKDIATETGLIRTNAWDAFKDLSSCVFMVLASIIVYFADEDSDYIKLMDPLIAVISLVVIVVTHVALGKKMCHILLLGIPEHMTEASLKEDIQFRFNGVVVEDFHLWNAMKGQIVATLVITYNDSEVYERTNGAIIELLRNQGITNLTVEPKIAHNPRPLHVTAGTCSMSE